MQQNPDILKRPPIVDEMRLPQMFEGLPVPILEVVRSHSGVVRLPAGTRISQRRMHQNKQLLFLIDGSWTFEDGTGLRQTIAANTTRARDPVFEEGQGDAVCTSETISEVLRIPLKMFELVKRHAPSPRPTNEDNIVREFELALAKNDINLPPMPDVAVRIARQIDDPDSTSDTIARIVQMDPSVAARLIQVVNSPMFGGTSKIDNAKDAITRLGRVETRDLVTCFVLKGIFRSRSPLLKQRMKQLWEHSTHIAAICHALAKRVKGIDPASALLLGLVHDIGIIPILSMAEVKEQLTKDAEMLERVIDRLRGKFSAEILQRWDFSEEFAEAAMDAEDWQHDRHEHIDYGDILVLAQLYAINESGDSEAVSDIEQLPAWKKLVANSTDGSDAIAILDEARQEILEVQSMIS